MNSAVAPLKPWEVASNPSNHQDSLISSNSLMPPPSLPKYNPQDSYTQQNGLTNSNWFGPPSYNYGSNRFGYPSGIGGPYSSYSGSNSMPFNVPPAPGNYLSSSFENTTRPLFESLNHVLQAVNHVACFVDSTIFAVWTSFAAAGSIVTAVKNIKNIYIAKVILSIRKYINLVKSSLKTAKGRRKALIVLSLIASIPLLIKALYIALKSDDKTEFFLENSDSGSEIELTKIDESNSLNETTSKTCLVRVIYPFTPSDNNTFLCFNPGDLIMISSEDLPKIENDPPNWILGRLKDGRSGYFSSNYVNKIN